MKIKGGSNVFYQAEFSTNRFANLEYLNATDTFRIDALTLSVGYQF